MPKFTELQISVYGHFSGLNEGMAYQASWPLFIIGQAWHRDCDFEDLADGFGPGNGTMGGDWSGIRDSGNRAVELMTERALNFLFGKE